MRSYPRNSPEAAARIVALVLISDGHVCRSEVDVLRQLRLEPQLGLAPGAFAQVMHTLCEDLLIGTHGRGSVRCSVDEAALASFLAEVDDPALQQRVLRLAGAAAVADHHLAEAEDWIVAAARRQWLRPEAGTAAPQAARSGAAQPARAAASTCSTSG
ncbi:MAG: hypothetical protein RIQ53_3576 [Pseudomonadota bacterium]|jgi:hypothetical protein